MNSGALAVVVTWPGAMPDGARRDYAFDHVVMATGHNWPETTEIKPRYFMSPWPAPARS